MNQGRGRTMPPGPQYPDVRLSRASFGASGRIVPWSKATLKRAMESIVMHCYIALLILIGLSFVVSVCFWSKLAYPFLTNKEWTLPLTNILPKANQREPHPTPTFEAGPHWGLSFLKVP